MDGLNAKAFAARGGRPALYIWSPKEELQVLTFAELDACVRRWEVFLHDAGVRPGSKVWPLWRPGSLQELVAMQIAFQRLWLTAVFVIPDAGLQAYLRMIDSVSPEVCIAPWPVLWLLRTLRYLTGYFKSVEKLIKPPARMEHLEQPGKDLVIDRGVDHRSAASPLLCYINTSATSGPSKLVPVKRRMFASMDAAVFEELSSLSGGGCNSVTLHNSITLPLHNLYRGEAVAMHAVGAGQPLQISPESVLGLLRAAGPRITSLCLYLPVLRELLVQAKAEGLQFEHLGVIGTAGAEVHPRLYHKVHEVAPNATIVGMYACTEVMPVAIVTSRDALVSEEKARCGLGLLVGKPHVCEVEAQTEHTIAHAKLDVGHLSWGRLAFRGSHVCNPMQQKQGGPLLNPELEWYYNGDVGWQDGAGNLYYMGRDADTVHFCTGVAVPAVALESVILFDNRIQACALLPLQNGEGLLLCELAKGVKLAEVKGEATRLLSASIWWDGIAGHLTIAQYCPQPEKGPSPLPVDTRHGAKVLRAQLRQQLETGRLVVRGESVIRSSSLSIWSRFALWKW